MKVTRFLFALLVLLSTGFTISKAQLSKTSLKIVNPATWWQSEPGTLEKASIAIHPKGAYTEMGMYLEFSARSVSFSATDNLEIEYKFSLPADAIINDSWLWIDDTTIVRAKILDIWTARGIYEDIVNRRRDPSILYKHNATDYELRIFPLPAGKSRKIKLTYLVPNKLTLNTQSVVVPLQFAKTSRNIPNVVHLLAWKETSLKLPTISGVKNNPFVAKQDDEFGAYFRADIPQTLFDADLTVNFETEEATVNPVSSYKDDDEFYFQSVISPEDILKDDLRPKKTLFLVDYTEFNSSLTTAQFNTYLKNAVNENMTSVDSINIMFAGNQMSPVFPTWRSYNIIEFDSILTKTEKQTYTNLHPLLFEGIDYINKDGANAEIVLLSNSFTFSGFTQSNDLIADLMESMNEVYSIHIIDYQDRNLSYVYSGSMSQYFYGNEYIYIGLARESGGLFKTYRNDGSKAFNDVMLGLGGSLTISSINHNFNGGFGFSTYSNLVINANHPLNKQIFTTGKYLGSLPLEITLNGFLNTKPISKKITLNENDILSVDSTLKSFWAGTKVKFLESQAQSNETVAEVIATSLASRVMSKYSAFLCLEPALGGEVCESCEDESRLTSIFDPTFDITNDSTFNAYPNPFNSTVSLHLKLNTSNLAPDASIYIYNVLGQVVKTFTVPIASDRVINFKWDGRGNSGSTMSTGTYFIHVKAGVSHYTKKVMLMK